MSSIKLHWLENRSKGGYVTFGVPWKKGEVTKETVFSVNDENGNAIAYQEKPIAYYPDGSTKWTSYTIKTDSETVEINKADKYDGFDGIKTNETEKNLFYGGLHTGCRGRNGAGKRAGGHHRSHADGHLVF